MERRQSLKTLGFATGALSLVSLQAFGATAAKKGAGDFSRALAECIAACEACIAHCQALLAKGDTMLAECLKRCLDVVPLCEATRTLAHYGSERLRKMARVCGEACDACAASCKPHVGHHDICKVCYEACVACSEACAKA